MKKIINIKEVMMIIICLTIVTISATVLATDGAGLIVTGGQNTAGSTIDANQYRSVQDTGNGNAGGNTAGNSAGNNSIGNNSNNIGNNSKANNSAGNNAKKYNTNNSSELPQTGIEDYNIGILLIICTISAIYAYNKVKQYKNI